MRSTLVSLMFGMSLSAIAADKLDLKSPDLIVTLKSQLSELYPNVTKKSFDYYYYGNGKAVASRFVTRSERKLESCYNSDENAYLKPISELTATYSRLDEFTEFHETYFSDAQGFRIFYCYTKTKPTTQEEAMAKLKYLVGTVSYATAVFKRGVNDRVYLMGLTDNSSKLALINQDGIEKSEKLHNLLFKNAKNGDIETGMKAYVEGMKDILPVMAVGTKFARAVQKNVTSTFEDDVTSFYKVLPAVGFKPNEIVSLTIQDEVMAGRVRGSILKKGITHLLVEVDDRLYNFPQPSVRKVSNN